MKQLNLLVNSQQENDLLKKQVAFTQFEYMSKKLRMLYLEY